MPEVESAPIESAPSLDGNLELESLQAGENPPVETPVNNRSSSFEIEGKQYAISEEQIRKHYGIPATEEITDKEWKTIISNYKANIHYNNKNREASQTKKTMEEAFRKLYDQPKETLKLLFQQDPGRLKATLEEMLIEEIEDEMLPQESRDLKKAQKEIEEYRRLLQEQEQTKRQAEQEALEAHYTQEIESDIIQAIEGSGVPKTPGTVRRISQYLLQGLNRGYDLKPKDVIKLVKEDYELEVKELFGSADPATIAALLGEGKMKELSKAQIQKVKAGFVQQRSLPSEDGGVIPPTRPDGNAKRTMTTDEFRAQAKKKIAMLK